MKALLTVLFAGVLLCAAAFCSLYYWGTAAHRSLLREQTPELAWLAREFNLTAAELARITRLHEAYQPHCAEMCRRIDEQNQKLKTLLNSTNAMTPDIESALADSGRLRVECQHDMLQHFLEVSRTMPPEQGRRYLEWIANRAFMRSHGGMSMAGH